ncbi:MAG: Fic family protein [Bacteroidota bacterium]
MILSLMRPPYQITSEIQKLIVSISEKTGAAATLFLQRPPAELRKKNRIKTIQSTLEIEGNTLSEKQITALLENKRVTGLKSEITEVKNAIEVYNLLGKFKAFNLISFCKAHSILMKGLAEYPGYLRTKAVGIVKGKKLTHLPPPGSAVKALMNDLFDYLKKDDEILLIKSCVFHYELEFIHPFMDGNGRMGRLWQTALLMRYNPVFEFLPTESLIKARQKKYYEALSASDKAGNSTTFIVFMLQIIDKALEELLKTKNLIHTAKDRISNAKEIFGKSEFTRHDYMLAFKNISTATASRDLMLACKEKVIKKTGDKRTAKYCFN